MLCQNAIKRIAAAAEGYAAQEGSDIDQDDAERRSLESFAAEAGACEGGFANRIHDVHYFSAEGRDAVAHAVTRRRSSGMVAGGTALVSSVWVQSISSGTPASVERQRASVVRLEKGHSGCYRRVDDSIRVYRLGCVLQVWDVAVTKPICGVDFSLRSHEIFPERHLIWNQLHHGDLQGLQRLLDLGKVTTFAQDPDGKPLFAGECLCMEFSANFCRLPADEDSSPPVDDGAKFCIAVVSQAPIRKTFSNWSN